MTPPCQLPNPGNLVTSLGPAFLFPKMVAVCRALVKVEGDAVGETVLHRGLEHWLDVGHCVASPSP